MEVSKERFYEFIENYDGPGALYSHEINFTTPSSVIYCDFGLHPETKPGIERIQACMVAKHVYPNPYVENSKDKYYIVAEGI